MTRVLYRESGKSTVMDELKEQGPFDYSFVGATARVALYDDMKSAPRITEVSPANTNEFIEKLTTTVYEQAKLVGGKVPYTLIREVSENFIHAQFKEIVVSILDDGNTIRFADQGPGIREKQKAQEPGFSSAIEPMKKYIRGVGSGFPIVRDYLDDRDGSIEIEDNLVSGAVITISLEQKRNKEASKAPQKDATFMGEPSSQREFARAAAQSLLPLTDREKLFLNILYREGDSGITELKEATDTPGSTTFNTLKKLEEMGLVQKTAGKKRSLTEFGYQVASQL